MIFLKNQNCGIYFICIVRIHYLSNWITLSYWEIPINEIWSRTVSMKTTELRLFSQSWVLREFERTKKFSFVCFGEGEWYPRLFPNLVVCKYVDQIILTVCLRYDLSGNDWCVYLNDYRIIYVVLHMYSNPINHCLITS